MALGFFSFFSLLTSSPLTFPLPPLFISFSEKKQRLARQRMPLQLDALFSRAKHPSHAYLSPDTTSAAPTSFYSPSWRRAPKVTSPPSDQRDIEVRQHNTPSPCHLLKIS